MKFSELVLSNDNHQDNIACFPYGLALLLSAVATSANGRVKNDIKSILNVGAYKDDYLIFQAQSMDINIKSKLRGGPSVEVNMLGAPRGYWPQVGFRRNVLDILKIVWNNLDNAFTPTTVFTANSKVEINDLTNFIRQNIGVTQENLGLIFLANAFYLEGHWAQPFTSIRYETFYGYSRISSVPMMSQVNVFEHGEIPELGMKYIRIPYANMEASMIIIMPINRGSSIERLGGKLQNFINFKPLYARKGVVELRLPKFQIDIFTSVKNHLEMLGLADMFTHSGVFDVAENHPVHLKNAVQKVIIKVDDTIIRNTAGLYTDGSAQSRFTVNQPFIALIVTDNVIIASAKINNM
ncbi:hypothetical protein PV328_001449 [Microctonus aethiopoides]|nr:hypothetical protein PV328_001449 [Microctonus aethiopoides]